MTNKEAQIILANLKQYISGGGVVDRGRRNGTVDSGSAEASAA